MTDIARFFILFFFSSRCAHAFYMNSRRMQRELSGRPETTINHTDGRRYFFFFLNGQTKNIKINIYRVRKIRIPIYVYIVYGSRENKTQKEVVNYRCYYTAAPTAGALLCIYIGIYGIRLLYGTQTRPLSNGTVAACKADRAPPPNALPVVLYIYV